jgi:hypothetical protein
MDDLTGKKFGHWLVLKDSGERSIHRASLWICQCDCGTIRKVRRNILLNSKKPRSCGCIRKFNAFRQFESHFNKTNGCWEWTGTLNAGGYGKWVCSTASRQAYKYYIGAIPQKMQVCHSCDNRKCVNPAHLFLGSITDNQKDKVNKNRQAKGSRIGSSTLNEEIVLQMRKDRLTGMSYDQLADKFSIDWYLVRAICKNRNWQHVALGEETKAMQQLRPTKKGSEMHTSILTEEKVIEIKRLFASGEKGKYIAAKFGVDQSTICDIKKGRTWKHII